MKRIAAVAALVALAVGPTPTQSTNHPPNILFILTDDQRADTAADPWMPNLQVMADLGLNFTNAFTVTSLCCPTRSTIFTGLFTHNHLVTGNGGYTDPDFNHSDPRMLPLKLQDIGYKTAMLGKYMLNTGMARPPGWDEWQVFTGNVGLYNNYTLNENGTAVTYGGSPAEYSTDVLRDKALATIENWQGAGPWYIEVGFFAPHKESEPAARHVGAWDDLEPWRPPNYQEDISDKPAWLGIWESLGGSDGARQSQLETLLAVDEAVGAFLDKLLETGQLNNTLVVFMSDGGMHWGEHWHENKASPYEESIRIPLVMYWPDGITSPREVPTVVSDVDIYPTLLKVAGTTPSPNNGLSLVPFFTGASGCNYPMNRAVLIEHFGTGWADHHYGVRTKRWKYLESYVKKTGEVTFRELYDLLEDPYELDNLLVTDPDWETVPSNAAILADLEAKLQQRLSE